MADSANPYDEFDNAKSSNPYDAFDKPQAGPVMAGIRHATTDLKSQAGEAASYGGRLAHDAGWNDLGNWLDTKAKSLKTDVVNNEDPSNTLAPDAGVVGRNAYGISQGLTQMAEVGGAGAATGAGIGMAVGSVVPGVGTAVGAIAGGALGWTIANVAALPALMGFSQAGRTAEQVAAKAQSEGASPEDANKQAIEAGGVTGAAVAGSQALIGAFGPLGKTLAPITKNIMGATTGEVVATALAQQGVKGLFKESAKAGAAGAAANVAGTAAVGGIEGKYGVGEGITSQGLIDSAVTGFGMTALAHGAHGAVAAPKFNKAMETLADPSADLDARQKSAAAATAAISVRDPALAENFGIYAAHQIATNQPVAILPDAAYHALGEDIKAKAGQADPQSSPSSDFQPPEPAVTEPERAPEQTILQGLSDIGSAPVDVNDFGGSLDRLQAANNADLSALTDALNTAHLQRAENAAGLTDMARNGAFSGVMPPDIAERTPTPEALAPERQFYGEQTQQAGADAAYAARDAGTPTVPADAFAQRQAALAAEAERMRTQGQRQATFDTEMAAGEQNQNAARGTDTSGAPTAMQQALRDGGVIPSAQRGADALAQGREGVSSQPVPEARPTAPEVEPLRAALARDAEKTGGPAPGAIEHVTRDMLPDERTPANNGIDGAATLSKKEYDTAKAAADVFGKKLIVFRQHGAADGRAFDGGVLRGDPRNVYLNADAAGAHHLVVFGHEMAHHMETDSPKLYREMEKTVASLAQKGGLADFAKYYGEPGNLKDAGVRARVTSEFVADLVGNRFGEMNTWRQVFAGVDQSNRGMVYRVANFVTKFIDRIMSGTRFKKFATDEMVTDLQATRNAIRRALTQYAQERGISRIQHEAEQMRAEAVNRRETVTRVESDRADVGRASDNRASAPARERGTENVQSNVGREPIRSPRQAEKETGQPNRLDAQIPEQLKPEQGQRAMSKEERKAYVAQIAKEAADELDRQRVERSQRAQKAGRASQQIGRSSDILDAISKLGGISAKDMRAIGATEASVPGRSATFRISSERGIQMDDMAQRLVEEGYLRDDTNVSPREQLEKAIGDALNGQPKSLQTEEGMRAEFERRQQQDYEDYVASLPESERAAVDDPVVQDAIRRTDDILNENYDNLTGERGAEYEQAIRNWYDRTQQEGGLREEAGDSNVPFDARAEEASGPVRDGSFSLQSESAAEGRARLTAEENARAQQHADERTAEQRAQADAMRDDFKLTGSNRDADVAAANGQQDMFSRERVTPEQEKSAGIYSSDPEVRQSAQRESWLGKLDPKQMAVVSNVLDMSPQKTKLQAMKEARKDWAKKMQQGIADQFAPIRTLDQHAYMLARLSKGTAGTMEAALMYGPPKLRDGVYDVDVKGKGAAAIFSQLKGEQNRFLLWEAAHRAEELKKAGKENLFTDTDISALKKLDAADPSFPDRNAVFKKVQQEYRDFNDQMLEVARDSGIMSDADYQLFKSQPYVPFYRVMEAETTMKGPRASGGLVNQYAFKKLKGGTEKLNADLLANVLNNWSHLLDAAAKNRAAVATMDAAEAAGIATRVPSDATGNNLVRVRHGGKEQKYEIEDPHLLAAVSAMSAQVPGWMKPLTTFKHILTRGVTAMPGFKVRNVIRDSISALAVGDLSANVPGNLKQGWQGLKHDNQVYASMLASGGIIRMGSGFDGAQAEYTHRLIAKGVPAGNILNNKGAVDALFGKAREVWRAYEELGDKSENINRAALYQQLLKQGKTHAEAAFLARDMMDFSMQGSWPVIRFLTQSVPFMNARIQGLYKLGRAAVDNPARVGAVVGSVMLASWALSMKYQDDPDWRNRPEWDRNNYWWFKIGDQAFRIPKPFEIGAVGTMAERTWELATDQDENAGRYGAQLWRIMADQLSFNPTPQIVKPLIDVYANKDSFTGKPIESAGMEEMKPEDRYSPGTSMTARFLGSLGLPDPVQLVQGRYQQLSPVQMDSILHGYFGGAGQLALGATDTILRAATDQPETSRTFGQTLGKALGNPVEPIADARSQYVDRFYDVAKDAQQAKASLRAAVRAGDREQVQELREKYKDDLRVYPMVEAATRALSNLATQEKRIQSNREMSSSEKRDALNAIAAKKAALTRRIIERKEALDQ
jgi:hypothetical protein